MKELYKSGVVRALTFLATQTLKRRKPYIIAITGNLGKTTTKDAIAHVLRDHVSLYATKKSENSEWGVPLTILGLTGAGNNPFGWLLVMLRGAIGIFDGEYPTHLVLEIGADKPGDISAITKWVKPDVVVITQFGEVPVHIEHFKNREAVVHEKAELLRALQPHGLFVWNVDDADGHVLKAMRSDVLVAGVGIHEKSDVHATASHTFASADGASIAGIRVDITTPLGITEAVLHGVIGDSPIYAILPAYAIGLALGMPLTVISDRLHSLTFSPGRMSLLPGMQGSSLIDDSYNASPKAMAHGLRTLRTVPAKRRIAVLGDMLELGDFSRDEHYKMGKIAAQSCHVLITSGIRARQIAEGALDAGMDDAHILQCESSILAGKELAAIIREGDVVYIKGSQGARMERTTKMVLASTHEPKAHLVRQDKMWL